MTEFLRTPLFMGVLLPFSAAALFTGLIRLIGWRPMGVACASAGIGAAFLLAYLVIIGLPLFPPRSASQKIVYLAGSGLVIGMMLDALRAHRLIVWAVLLLWPAVIIGWLGERHVAPMLTGVVGAAPPDRSTLLLLGLFWAAGSLILVRLRRVRERGLEASVMLLVAALGLGFLALQSAASSLGLLGIALAMSVAGFLLWNWPKRRYPFGCAAVLGGGTALLAVAAELGLFALSQTALVALALLVLVFFADRPSRRLVAESGRSGMVMAPIILAATAAIPVLIALAFAGLAG